MGTYIPSVLGEKRTSLWIWSAEGVSTAGIDKVAFTGPAVGGLHRMRAPQASFEDVNDFSL